MRLINENDAVKKVTEKFMCSSSAVYEMFRTIPSQKATDHGYWILTSHDGRMAQFECSQCHNIKEFFMDRIYVNAFPVDDYCSRCGAAMDENPADYAEDYMPFPRKNCFWDDEKEEYYAAD